MTYDTCHSCGEHGHFARSCTAGTASSPAPPPSGSWTARPARTAAAQERINIRGGMKIRAAIAQDWELFDRIDSIRHGDADEAECTAALVSLGI